MLTGIYSAASAMRTAQFQQDVISTNLAHLNVPGFRRSLMAASTFGQERANQQNNVTGSGGVVHRLAIDFQQGPMVSTGRSLDVAVGDDGFLAVEAPNATLYTKNGGLQMNEARTLVGNHGMPILGENGPITIPEDVSPGDLSISKDGSISAGENRIGKLRLVRFENNDALKQVGTTLFSADDAVISGDPAFVLQGMREQSNVEPIDELVSMIVAMRYHEAAQKTLTSIDDSIHQQTNPQG